MSGNQHHHAGKVILAGAGPGDPELITIKLAAALSEADVIVVDRLVNSEIIRRFARDEALIIHVGKKGYSSDSTRQEEINKILVQCAHKYRLTVRLKGGDTSLFSNILDELFILSGFTIPFEIIPGITAASGASAFCGIPLTARGYADRVRFLTGHELKKYSSQEWKELSLTNDTLVYYMGNHNAPELMNCLLQQNPLCNKPVAIIESATTNQQKVWISNVQRYSTDAAHIRTNGPTLIIVGDVVSLHHRFNWFMKRKEENQMAESAFKN